MADKATKSVHVQYFAALREQSGLSAETLNTGAATAGALYGELKQKYNFSLPPELLQVSVNSEFKTWDTELAEDDRIVFIPPVAGG